MKNKQTIDRAELLIASSEKVAKAYINALFDSMHATIIYDPSLKNEFKIVNEGFDKNSFISLSNMKVENDLDKEISKYKVYMGPYNERGALGYVNDKLKKFYVYVPDLDKMMNASLDKIVAEYKPKLEMLKKKLYSTLADTNKRTGTDYVSYVNKQIGSALIKLVSEDTKQKLYPIIEENFSVIVHEMNHVYDSITSPEIFNDYIGSNQDRVGYVSQLAEVLSIVYQTYYEEYHKISDKDKMIATFDMKYFVSKFANGEYFRMFYGAASKEGKQRYIGIIVLLYMDFYNKNYDKFQKMEYINGLDLGITEGKPLDYIIPEYMLVYLLTLSKEKRTHLVHRIIKEYSDANKITVKDGKELVLDYISKNGRNKLDINKKFKVDSKALVDRIMTSGDKVDTTYKKILNDIDDIDNELLNRATKALNHAVSTQSEEARYAKRYV